MTTEEALAVADSVQFGMFQRDRSKPSPLASKTPASPPPKTKQVKVVDPTVGPGAKTYNPPGGVPQKTPHDPRRKKRIGGHNITIHADSVHLSEDAAQFAEATKGRLDAAERQAMRRAIARANIHPAVKVALLRHSAAVQFSDSGEEYPSVPMTWVLKAAKGILQMAIVPQTMEQMNHGMREKVLDSLYSGDNNALDAVAELLEKHGLHDELIAMLHGGHDYGEPRPEDVMDREKQIAVNEMHDR